MVLTSPRERVFCALASLLIVAGGIFALVAGLAMRIAAPDRRAVLAAVLFLSERKKPPPAPRPTPPPAPRPARKFAEKPTQSSSSAAKGRPSPANLHNRATPIVAPTPMVALPVPQIVITSPVANSGAASSNGASDRVGPGQGAGGMGDGFGGGGNGGDGSAGDGSGGNGARDALTRPRQIAGRLHFSDLPPDLRENKSGGELELQYRIGIDGRVSDCRIRVSSGRSQLDIQTCRLITERFRFRPSRNARGQPVPSIMIEKHGWYFHPEDED